jgi:hypothetical protein
MAVTAVLKNAATTNTRMFRFLSAAAAAIALATASITDCDPTSVFRPTELSLVPDPPVRGQPVTMTVKFNNPGAEITDGKVVTSISLNGLPLTPSTEPLCENTQCPLVSGANDRTATSTWPGTVSGKVVSKSQWFGSAGESLLCIQTNVRVAATETKKLRGSWLSEGALAALRHVFQHDAEYKALVVYGPPKHSNDTCPLWAVLDN